MSAPDMSSNEDTSSVALLQPEALPNVDDIIPATVFVPITNVHTNIHHNKPSFIDRMKDLKNKALVSEQSLEKEKQGKLRMVYLPCVEYLKYFVKDKDGNYIGVLILSREKSGVCALHSLSLIIPLFDSERMNPWFLVVTT